MLDKTARKPSADPVQEKLRQDKALWNKGISAFIANLINLKKTMNGLPSKYFKERSKIVNPIPANPATIIDSLAGNFQELAQQGSAIVQEQLDYSKHRRPKQPKALEAPESPKSETTTPAPSAPAPDLSKQLAAWEQKYEMVVEGSNPISRWLTRRKTWTKGTSEKIRVNQVRMNMLKEAVKVRKLLNKLQVEIVKSSPQSIIESYDLMKKALHIWKPADRVFSIEHQKFVDKQTKETENVEKEEEEISQPETGAPPVKDITMEDVVPPPPTPQPTQVVPPTPIPQSTPPEVPAEEKKKKIDDMVKRVLEKTKQQPATVQASAEMEVIAQKFIKKWLGKKRHQFLPGDTSNYRLEIFEIAKQIRIDLNEMLNSLEKGWDIESLAALSHKISKQMTNIQMMLRSLHMQVKPGGGSDMFEMPF